MIIRCYRLLWLVALEEEASAWNAGTRNIAHGRIIRGSFEKPVDSIVVQIRAC